MRAEALNAANALLVERIAHLDRLVGLLKENPDLAQKHPQIFTEAQRCRNTAHGLLVALEVMDEQFREVADLAAVLSPEAPGES